MTTKVRQSSQLLPESVTITTTGNIDDLDFGNAALIRMNNTTTTSTIRGLKAGTDGQRVTIVSVGTGEVDFAHQNAGSSAANRLINYVTSGITPLAAGVGTATYQYDGTTSRWRLVDHEQGAPIQVAYSAGLFSSDVGTWTLPSGATNLANYAIMLNGRLMSITLWVTLSTITGPPRILFLTLPNSYIAASRVSRTVAVWVQDGAGDSGGVAQLNPGGSGGTTKLEIWRDVSESFYTAITAGFYVGLQTTVELT